MRQLGLVGVVLFGLLIAASRGDWAYGCRGEFRQPEKTVHITKLGQIKPNKDGDVIYLEGSATRPQLVSGKGEYCWEHSGPFGSPDEIRDHFHQSEIRCAYKGVIPLVSASDTSKSPSVYGWVVGEDGGPRWDGGTVVVEFPRVPYFSRSVLEAVTVAKSSASIKLRQRNYPSSIGANAPVVHLRKNQACMGASPGSFVSILTLLFFSILIIWGRD